MRKLFAIAAVITALTALPQAAEAAQAYTAAKIAVRAGPGPNYPTIGYLPRGSGVDIRGCSNGYRYCDVSARGFRGWVAGNLLRSKHERRNVNVVQFGNVLGLPLLSFQEKTYWGTHYYDRDFYKTRYGWNNDHRTYGWTRTNDGRWSHSRNWRDTDRDGVSNRYDNDDDNDGIRDSRDRDDDGDGIRDNRDRDDRDRDDRVYYRDSDSGRTYYRYNN